MVDKACMSAYHFHRICRTVTGEPINVTVRGICLLKAYIMLLRNFMNQQNIAKQVQYGCAAAFNRAFIRLYGMYAHFKLQKNALNSVQGIKNMT